MNELQQIHRYFEYYCHRAPDAAALRAYAEHLERGSSLHTLHLAIARSDEAREKAGRRRPGNVVRMPDIDAHYAEALAALETSSPATAPEVPAAAAAAPAPAAPMTEEEVYLSFVYLALLGRRPDESGLQGYLGAMRNGLPLKQVVEEIFFSGEAQSLRGHSRVTERITTLRRLVRFKPLERACTWVIEALIAAEMQRLWKERLTPNT